MCELEETLNYVRLKQKMAKVYNETDIKTLGNDLQKLGGGSMNKAEYEHNKRRVTLAGIALPKVIEMHEENRSKFGTIVSKENIADDCVSIADFILNKIYGEKKEESNTTPPSDYSYLNLPHDD